jgi:phosphocarrier protein
MCLTKTKSAEVVIKNRLGLHARAAAQLVRAAGSYSADIRLVKNGETADARSVLGLISLGCVCDTRIIIEAEGDDAQTALQALIHIIEDRFGEE